MNDDIVIIGDIKKKKKEEHLPSLIYSPDLFIMGYFLNLQRSVASNKLIVHLCKHAVI